MRRKSENKKETPSTRQPRTEPQQPAQKTKPMYKTQRQTLSAGEEGGAPGREENNASEEEVLLPPRKSKLQRIRKKKKKAPAAG